MSKTQDKKQERIAEAAGFVKERRRLQLHMLEQNYETGVKLYEAQKETLSAEEVEKIEGMMKEQRDALDKLQLEVDPNFKA
jgi:uncharacterized Fe-S cluster-containing radical SAM superfamily protein